VIRLFVAIDVPADLRQRMSGLSRGIPGANWVPEENIHITLRFIGEVFEHAAEDIVHALAEIDADPFDVAISGAGHFETGNKVRALWLGVERNDALIHLRDRVESALVRCGIRPEGRRFKPHVTLARLKDVAPEKARGWLQANTLFKAMPFRVDRFVLYSSFVTRNGSLYRPEEVFHLVPDGPEFATEELDDR